MGFTYFPSVNKEFKIGHRKVELDYIFLYENIILICEDTCGKSKNKDHIRNKNEAFSEIMSCKGDFLTWMKETFSEKKSMLDEYRTERFLIFFIYISQTELDITEDEREMYANLVFWEPDTLAYFYRVAHCLYHSGIYELFRMLNIKSSQVGHSGNSGSRTEIKAPIIYPDDITGLRNGVRVVSFMMSAENLLQTCCSLSWRNPGWNISRY